MYENIGDRINSYSDSTTTKSIPSFPIRRSNHSDSSVSLPNRPPRNHFRNQQSLSIHSLSPTLDPYSSSSSTHNKPSYSNHKVPLDYQDNTIERTNKKNSELIYAEKINNNDNYDDNIYPNRTESASSFNSLNSSFLSTYDDEEDDEPVIIGKAEVTRFENLARRNLNLSESSTLSGTSGIRDRLNDDTKPIYMKEMSPSEIAQHHFQLAQRHLEAAQLATLEVARQNQTQSVRLQRNSSMTFGPPSFPSSAPIPMNDQASTGYIPQLSRSVVVTPTLPRSGSSNYQDDSSNHTNFPPSPPLSNNSYTPPSTLNSGNTLVRKLSSSTRNKSYRKPVPKVYLFPDEEKIQFSSPRLNAGASSNLASNSRNLNPLDITHSKFSLNSSESPTSSSNSNPSSSENWQNHNQDLNRLNSKFSSTTIESFGLESGESTSSDSISNFNSSPISRTQETVPYRTYSDPLPSSSIKPQLQTNQNQDCDEESKITISNTTTSKFSFLLHMNRNKSSSSSSSNPASPTSRSPIQSRPTSGISSISTSTSTTTNTVKTSPPSSPSPIPPPAPTLNHSYINYQAQSYSHSPPKAQTPQTLRAHSNPNSRLLEPPISTPFSSPSHSRPCSSSTISNNSVMSIKSDPTSSTLNQLTSSPMKLTKTTKNKIKFLRSSNGSNNSNSNSNSSGSGSGTSLENIKKETVGLFTPEEKKELSRKRDETRIAMMESFRMLM